nr:hypothetical protein [Tanacetum cinerariifolium]GEY84013.1 hypothetical protein [Tanacetum cinerariifolium]
MGCLPGSACLGSLSLTQSPNSLVLGEGLEIWDNHLCAIREHLGDSEWSRPMGLKLSRENLQYRIKEEDSITDVKNAVFDFGVMDSLRFLLIDQRSEGHSCNASRPSKLCAQVCLVLSIINTLYLTTVSFGVDAAMDLKEKHKVFNAAGEELSAAKQKFMLLD